MLQALKVSNKIAVVEFQATHLLQGSFRSIYRSCVFRKAVSQDFCFFVLPSSVDSVNSVTEKPSVLQALKVSNKITVVEFHAAHLVQGKVHFDLQ